MDISKKAEQMTEENGLSAEVNQAYINIVGEQYAEAAEAEEAYQGEYSNDEDFAQNMADELGLVQKEVAWPYTCIDWEQAARELMQDYSEDNGYYFRNL